MYADGLDAFDKLEEILNLLKKNSPVNQEFDNLEILLKNSKN